MSFLNPAAFWGFAALAIPLAIHFWHRKKGRLVSWAAMQWLPERTSLASRGLQLDDVPLLLIRILLLMSFVLLLARPVFDFLQRTKSGKTVHLVQRDKFLVENFRFELDAALRRGESVRWIDEDASELAEVKSTDEFGSLNDIQSNIATAMLAGDSLQLYLQKDHTLLDLPEILVPGSFKIHWIAGRQSDHAKVSGFQLADGVTVAPGGQDGLLTNFKKRIADFTGVHAGPVSVRVHYADRVSAATVSAALLALKDVYGIPFEWWEKGDKEEDMLFTDQSVTAINKAKLYFLPNVAQSTHNVHRLGLPLTAQSSDLVAEGALPEWLGERILQFYGIRNAPDGITENQLETHFRRIDVTEKPRGFSSVNLWMLACLLVLVCLERYYVFYKKTASHG